MFRAGSRAAKFGVIAFELAGVVIAVAAAGAALLYWRLQSGPVSLSLFETSAEHAIRRSLPDGHGVDIKSASLAKAASPGRYDLSLEKIVITDRRGAAIADLSAVELEFLARDLVHGRFGPRRIVINDAAFTIERSLERAPTGKDRNPARLLSGEGYFRQSLRSAILRNAQIRFHDAASDRSWRAHDASAAIDRTDSGYRAQVEGKFDIDGAEAGLRLDADYSEVSGLIDAAVEVVDAPIGDLLATVYGRQAAVFSGPVTGRVSLKLSQAGAILASRIDGHVGAGELRLGAAPLSVDFIDLTAAFDPALNAFQIEMLAFAADGSRGSIKGAVGVELQAGSASPVEVRFDLTGENLLFDTKGFLAEPLAVDSARLTGAYDAATRRFSADRLAMQLLGAEVSGGLEFAPALEHGGEAPVSPAIKGRIEVSGALDPQRILRGWPINLGATAREFVAERLPKGRAENIVFDIDLPAGSVLPGGPAPDGALSLTFDISDAAAIYSPGMTPLTNASGSGRLTGNRFVMKRVKGRVGAVAISDGEIDFTALSPKGKPVYYRFTAEGEAKDILGILNEEPLALLKGTDLAPTRFIGGATVRAEISRPNLAEAPRESYGFSGRAKFGDLTLSEFFGGAELTKASGTVDFNSRSMTVKTDASLGDSPVEIEWINYFYSGEGQSRFHITGEVDSSTGDVFGIPTRQMLRGPVSFAADAIGDLGGIDTLAVNADFTDAALLIDAFGWRKPQGVPATGALDLAFARGGIDVRGAELTGDALSIKGDGRFGLGGVVEHLNFERFFLAGAADFAASAARTESGLLDITLTGSLLNSAQLIQSAVESGASSKRAGSSGWGAGVMLRGRVDELRARGGSIYRDATLDFRRGREGMEALEFSARTAAGKPLSIVLKETGSDAGPRQVIEARTDDIGSLLSGIFAVSSVKGGEGYMELLARDADKAGGVTGVLEARNMRVVGAPLLARIFAAGSLTGLVGLLNGEGIALNEAYARFGLTGGVVTVDEARATGPSVGITSAGSVATGEGGLVALSGAVAPAYQVNSLLGKAPLIGDILVNREGEGVVALSYNVAGPSAAPTVTVNPLSALTPGFLRRMFEGREPISPEGSENPETESQKPETGN